MTHICVRKLSILGSDNGLSPGRRQAIIWTNAGMLFNWTLRTNFSEILSEIHTFSFKQMRLKMSSGKWRPYCLGLNVLTLVSLYKCALKSGDSEGHLVQVQNCIFEGLSHYSNKWKVIQSTITFHKKSWLILLFLRKCSKRSQHQGKSAKELSYDCSDCLHFRMIRVISYGLWNIANLFINGLIYIGHHP